MVVEQRAHRELLPVGTAHGFIGPTIDVLGERDVCLRPELRDGTMIDVAAAPRFAGALGGPFPTAYASLRERGR